MTEQVIIPAPTALGTCNQCLYWDGLEVAGYCRRSAPTVGVIVGMDGRTFWPRTLPTDWCGDWTQAPVARTEQVVDGAS